VEEIDRIWNIVENQSVDNIMANLLKDFNEYVVLSYLKAKNELGFDLNIVVNYLKELSEQSYENKTLYYGIIIDKKKQKKSNKFFLFHLDFQNKKYKALSDGYKTSFVINNDSKVIALADIQDTVGNSPNHS